METSLAHYKPIGYFFRHSRSTNSASGRSSNTSMILCLSFLPASLKRIRLKATGKKRRYRYFSRSRAANSIVSSWILPKFELIYMYALMHILITCKYQKDWINQRTNGPVNAHLISGATVSTKASLAKFDIILIWVKVNSGSSFI